MKIYSVSVNASPRYPIKEIYTIKAASWAIAISRAVKRYFKEHKHFRTDFCDVNARYIGKELGQDNEAA